MEDDKLKQEKYLCNMQSGTEGLAIADLFMRDADGKVIRVISLQKGQYIPTDLIDAGDLKKSRLFGSLKKCIDRRWIVVENPAIDDHVEEEKPVEMEAVIPEQAVTEIDAGTVSMKDVTSPIADSSRPKGIPAFPEDKQPPIKEIVSKMEATTVNIFAISEGNAVTAKAEAESKYNEFSNLRYFQKLKAIKDTKDTALLGVITKKSEYPQLIHNAESRLKELRESK